MPTIALSLDILDAAIEANLRKMNTLPDYGPGWVEFSREELTSGSVKFDLKQPGLGKLGEINLRRIGDTETDVDAERLSLQDRILSPEARAEIDDLPEAQRHQRLMAIWPAIDAERESEPLREKNFVEIIRALFGLLRDDPAIRLAVDAANLQVSSLVRSAGEETRTGVIASEVQERGKSPEAEVPDRYIFRKIGDYWDIIFGSEHVVLKATDGVVYIKIQLQYKHQRFSGVELVALAEKNLADPSNPYVRMTKAQLGKEGLSLSKVGKRVPKMDPAGINQIQQAREKLFQDFLKAQTEGKDARANELLDEIEKVDDYLASVKGFKGEPRPETTGDKNESTRIAVYQAVRRVLEKLARKTECPALYKHLKSCLKSENGFYYDPALDPENRVSWTF